MVDVVHHVREQLLDGVPVDERRLVLAGLETAVLEGGEGPPLVLLHGPGEHAAKWLRVLPGLVRRYRVIAPDLPAHGQSAAPDPDEAADRVLEWLDELVGATCTEPPALVGQLIGGAIAARYVSGRPHRARALVLVDALGLAAFEPAPQFGEALMAYLARPSEASHDGLWERCARDLGALRESMGERWVLLRAYNLDRAAEPGLRAAQGALMEAFGVRATPGDELARIAVPTTLVWGRHDLATPLHVAEQASVRYGWPLHVIDGAADDPPMEKPDEFTDVLRIVLQEV